MLETWRLSSYHWYYLQRAPIYCTFTGGGYRYPVQRNSCLYFTRTVKLDWTNPRKAEKFHQALKPNSRGHAKAWESLSPTPRATPKFGSR